MKLNSNETVAFVTTILQERYEKLFEQIEQLAIDTMTEIGVPESDLDHRIATDYTSGLIEKLVHRFKEGEWPTGQFSDEIESLIKC